MPSSASDFQFDLNSQTDDTGLVAHGWLQGKHRGLLAPVGVGTVDQTLSAVLREKYNMVKLAAVANTHVVFDEAHSYDLYQQELFSVLLRWLGLHRAPVTILSATMPSELATKYCSAYLSGWNAEVELSKQDKLTIAYPGVVAVSYTHLTLPTTPYV